MLDNKDFTYKLCGKDVVVIGGGDTANDCLATAVRENAKSVLELEITKAPPLENTLPWPNFPNKKKNDYGVLECNTIYNKDIRRYETTIDEVIKDKDSNIKSIIIKKVKFENGKFIDVENTKEEVKCDFLIIAMGFNGTSDEDLSNFGLKAYNNRVLLDGFKYDDKISVCGDMKNGQSLVVVAISGGIKCAREIIEKYKY